MNIFKRIDIYGNFFNFYINQHEKLKTTIGGIFTVMTLILGFCFSFFFGRDFYFRSNPLMSNQAVFNDIRPSFKLEKTEKFFFAWRIENNEGEKIDFDDIFFPKVYYNFYKDNNDGVFNITYRHKFEIKKCDEFSKQVNISSFINVTKWNCLFFDELNNKSLTGNYNDKGDLGEIQINLDSCSYDETENYALTTGGIVNRENSKCSNQKKLNEFFSKNKNKVYINLMIPLVILQPNHFDQPVTIRPYFYFKKIDYILNSEDYIYFDFFTLTDDKGWIVPSDKNSTYISYSNSKNNFKNIPENDYEKNENINFYQISLLMNRIESYSKRKFMKIQDLAAISGGFISSLMLIFTILNYYFCQLEKNKILVNSYFNNFYKNPNCIRFHKSLIDERIIFYKREINKELFVKKNIISKKNNFYENKLIGNNTSMKKSRDGITSEPFIEKISWGLKKIEMNNHDILNKNENEQNISNINVNNLNTFSIAKNFNENYNLKSNKVITLKDFNKIDIVNSLNNSKDFYYAHEKLKSFDSKRAILNFANNTNKKKELLMDGNEDINDISNEGLLRIKSNLKLFDSLKKTNNYSEINFLKYLPIPISKIFTCKKYSTINKIYILSEQIIFKKIDILNYLKTLQYVKLFKNILLNRMQKFYFNNYYGYSININYVKSIESSKEKFNEKKNKLEKYLNEKLMKIPIENEFVDKIILEKLSENFTNNYIND